MAYIPSSEFKSRRLPDVINVKEFNEILKFTKHKHHKVAFKLGFLCGLRVGEVSRLIETDIDLERGYIFVRKSKWGRDRYVPIPNPLRRDLKNFSKYKKIGVRAYQKIFKIIARKALDRDLHFHNLRHSCATYCLNQGMNIRQVQMLLGHSNVATTSIYLHVDINELKGQIDEIWK